ncbi:MAG: TIGR01212 family radical SAM protein [Deltaproteobacteria bacterium RBG_19FT_COMBO_46_9]|jgi:radical SAM protein (TIGR01212 family)|nr:MAG: TIGR01212 family radical SAM protein [Deltaproteobacteria bacterium RBG_19FT_COMBO_46_9]
MKRYRDYNSYLRDIFGERVQKISLDAGFSCPNRDGTISDTGCIFCDSRGSGSGAMIKRGLSIDEQIMEGIRSAVKRYKARKFIAYFQSFTNTYAPLPRLRELYTRALDHEGMVGLSIGTRPDCVDKDILALISSFKRDYLVWIEFGLQSAHDITLSRINRGHDVACFEKGVMMAMEYGLNICAHVIIGLPGEDREMMMETARYISCLPIAGVKIHCLYVTRGTPLAGFYEEGEYDCLTREEYVECVVDFLELLPSDMVIQRLTGDPLRKDLIDPPWALKKTENIRLINRRLEERDTWQGKRYLKSTAGR